MTEQVSQSWVRFIKFCREKIWYGDVCVHIVRSNPTSLIDAKREIRFDRPLIIPETLGNQAVSEAWKNLITFCRTEIPKGDLSIHIVSGEPTNLLAPSTREIRFDCEYTIPKVLNSEIL